MPLKVDKTLKRAVASQTKKSFTLKTANATPTQSVMNAADSLVLVVVKELAGAQVLFWWAVEHAAHQEKKASEQTDIRSQCSAADILAALLVNVKM